MSNKLRSQLFLTWTIWIRVFDRKGSSATDTAIELIVTAIQRNLKNPKLHVALIIFIIIVALVFPYVDANFFFYSRIERRVSILQSLSEIDIEKVNQSPALQEEYNAILSDIEKQREWSISGIISSEQPQSNVPLFKFLSGGALAWIFTLCVPFMNTFEDKKAKMAAFLLLALFGGLLGGIGYFIPTILNPWVNYIGYPFLQLVALVALTIKPKQE